MAKDLRSVEDVRSLTDNELGKLSAANAKLALKTILQSDLLNMANQDNDAPEAVLRIESKLDKILEELKVNKTERDLLRDQLQALSEENKRLGRIIYQHQRYLETVDAEKRLGNLIITGIPEGQLVLGDETLITDEDKCKAIFTAIGKQDTKFREILRLGKTPTDANAYTRPVKVCLENPPDRKAILENAKQLKEAGDTFKRIYIKKDMHPGIRKEFARLKESEKTEKQKPENQGKQVVYDHSTRQVKVDGIVVDQFQPTFF